MDDVIVSGAGPAGSLAALILARAGVRVRVIERAVFPRDKMCGDTLNPGALSVLGRHLDLEPLFGGALPIDGMILTGPGGVAVRGAYPAGITGRAILRRDLDHRMAAAAAAAGAGVEEGSTVVGPVVRDGAVTGVRVRSPRGAERAVMARTIIAADGRRSRLAFACGLARQPARPRRWAVGAYFDGVSGMTSAGEMHVGRGRYLGLAPTPGGLTNVCAVSTPHTADPRWREPQSLLAAAIAADAALAARFESAHRATPVTVLGPMAVEVARPGMPGLLLAGDAAGFIDPMTGDGLRFALEGAELAADVALDSLSGRLAPDRALVELSRRRRARFSRKWRFNRAVRRLVDHPAGVAGAALAARVLPGIFARMIAYAGDCANEK